MFYWTLIVCIGLANKAMAKKNNGASIGTINGMV